MKEQATILTLDVGEMLVLERTMHAIEGSNEAYQKGHILTMHHARQGM